MFIREIAPAEILKFRSIKPDSVSAIVYYGYNFFRELDVAHNFQFNTIGCFGREMTVSGNYSPLSFVIGLPFFEPNKGLIGGMDNDNSRSSIHNDNIIVFY